MRCRLSFKTQKYKDNSLRFTITDKAIKDEIIDKLKHGDILIVELIEIIEKGKMMIR